MHGNFISQIIKKKGELVRGFLMCGVLAVSTISLPLNNHEVFADEGSAEPTKLWIGTATADITPSEPVALNGQRRIRIAKEVESPVTANAVAIESRQGDRSLDYAVMVSCDLAKITPTTLDYTRSELKKRLPELDVRKVFLCATHTHTGPCINPTFFKIPKTGVMQVDAYLKFSAERIAEAIEKAWKARQPGGVSWGLGHAVVACNRRMVYDDGSVKMYGPTNVDKFQRVEGPEDHGVEVLFFWDGNKKLIAAAVNVACPAQEVEGRSAVNADFWHEVRERLHKKYGKDLCVLAWCGAAGDQSPHLMWRKAAEERMRKLRGLTRLDEIARRIVRAVDDAYEGAKSEVHYDAPLVHVVEDIKLPARLVTDADYARVKGMMDALKNKKEPGPYDYRHNRLYQDVLDRYESQKTYPYFDMEMHVLRLGDIGIATNSFELFTDYGIQIKGRSKSLQTFVIQLAGLGTYVPTLEATKAGDYGARVLTNLVGPKGGEMLVDRTVEKINDLWKTNGKQE